MSTDVFDDFFQDLINNHILKITEDKDGDKKKIESFHCFLQSVYTDPIKSKGIKEVLNKLSNNFTSLQSGSGKEMLELLKNSQYDETQKFAIA